LASTYSLRIPTDFLQDIGGVMATQELPPIGDRTQRPRTPEQFSMQFQERPPKTNDQIASEWDAAFNSNNKDFTTVTRDIQARAQQAFARGGVEELKNLETALNDKIRAENAGPMFVMQGSRIEIHNGVQVAKDGKEYSEYIRSHGYNSNYAHQLTGIRGDLGYIHEFSRPVTVDATDKPVQSTPIRPGEKLSAEYPSEYAIARAFQAGNMLNKDWMTSNTEQRYLVDHLGRSASELGQIPRGVIDGIASVGDEKPINNFLQQHGFDIKLDRLGKDDVGLAATLALKGAWSGEASQLKVDNKTYPAALVHDVKTFKQGNTDVVQLYKKDGITVYAAPIGDEKLSSFQVTQKAQGLTPNASTPSESANTVLLPMVSKNVSVELDGLKGMRATDGTHISQAKMQTKLAIDESGFDVKQGVAFAVSKGMNFPLTIDKPFIVWATCDGCSEPLFATTVDQRYWKDPKKAN
jgi:hypothetical protein